MRARRAELAMEDSTIFSKVDQTVGAFAPGQPSRIRPANDSYTQYSVRVGCTCGLALFQWYTVAGWKCPLSDHIATTVSERRADKTKWPCHSAV